MPLKIDLLLPNSSQYGVLHHFTAKLFEAFKRAGFAARLLKKEEYSSLLFEDPPDCTVGFNGAPRDEKGEFLCDRAFVPHFSCLVDPPYRFPELQTSPYILIGCDDKACVDLFRTKRHPHYYFFPHGVEPELAPDPSLQRGFDVVFLGSFIDPDKRRDIWRQQYSIPLCEVLEETADECLTVREEHFIRRFLENINNKALKSIVAPFNLAEVLQELELYLKARDRVDLLRAITSHRVDVFGNAFDEVGWEELFADRPNITVHPAVDYEKALRIMQQAKIVLNSGVKSVYGAHERVFSGLAAGAAVMTSSNPFLKEHFNDRESILFFRHGDLGAVDEKLSLFLSNEGARAALAAEGRRLVLQHHTWDARLSALLPDILPVVERLSC